LAGQITMEGFLRFRIKPWLRRLVTRSVAIAPAVAVILYTGDEDASIYQLLIFSQVVLSLQLPFAVVPLVKFTSNRQKMGPFVNPRWVRAFAWLVAAIIITLNAALVYQEVREWMTTAGAWGWLIGWTTIPLAIGLAILLAWLVFRPQREELEGPSVTAAEVAAAAIAPAQRFRRIGVALDVRPTDAVMLAQAVALARTHRAELVLMHVVDGVGGTWYGPQTGDLESREDEQYLHELADRLRRELADQGVPRVEAVLGYGNPAAEIIQLAREKEVDLMVLGGHGHRGLADLLFGQTIAGVRHGLRIPVLAVREG
jgi:manganese transport protein